MARNILKKIAGNIPSTSNPRTIYPVRITKKAFIKNVKRPNERILIGSVKIIKKGLIKRFKKAKTNATKRADIKSETKIPGRI